MSAGAAPARPARQRSGPRLAFWLESTSLAACEIAASLGYDAVIFDIEHGVLPMEACDYLTLCCKRLGLTVYSRIAAADRVAIQHALDAGADGVVLPQITDLAHARAATAFAKYPPLGSRGIGYNRTTGYGGAEAGFFAAENRRTACYPMIETPGALAEAEAIARLETVDGLFIGPSDLSLTRGRGPYRATKADFADMARVAEAALAAGKSWALPAPSRAVLDFATERGASFVTVSDDLTALRVGLAQGLALVGKG